MRRWQLSVAVLLAGAMVIPARAFAQAATADSVACKDGTMSKAGKGACSHHGGVVHATTTAKPASATAKPTTPSKTTGTTVTCKDGTTSKSGKGACSHHGGVAPAGAATTPTTAAPASPSPAAPPPKPATKPTTVAPAGPPPAGATAMCKDGTYSKSKQHSGACSHHGGVSKWLDSTATH
jgi:serine/threonine-protein kinase